MNADTVQTLGQALVLGVLGGYAAWKARKADMQTRDTGNGFAENVTKSLDELKESTKRIEKKIDDHVRVHAEAQIYRGMGAG